MAPRPAKPATQLTPATPGSTAKPGQADPTPHPDNTLFLLSAFVVTFSLYLFYDATFKYPFTLLYDVAEQALRQAIAHFKHKQPSEVDLQRYYASLGRAVYAVPVARVLFAVRMTKFVVQSFEKTYKRIQASRGPAQ